MANPEYNGRERLPAAGLAVIFGLAVAALWPAAARTDAVSPELEQGFAVVDECGARFLELSPQAEPTRFTWREFGEPIASYYGVIAYAHGREGDPRRDNTLGLYQCTELAHRYLREVYGVPTRIGLGLGHGVDLARKVAARFDGQAFTGGIEGATPVTLRYFANGKSACRPMVGSIVSIAMAMPDGTPTPGHVAIVRNLIADGLAYEATLFEQHGGDSLEPGEEVEAGRIRFERLDGAWVGRFYSRGGFAFPVEGWTSVAVATPP